MNQHTQYNPATSTAIPAYVTGINSNNPIDAIRSIVRNNLKIVTPVPTEQPEKVEPVEQQEAIEPEPQYFYTLKCEKAIPDFIREYLGWNNGVKADVERDPLTRALYVAKSVVERRNTIPILSNVKLTESNGKLEIIGTDLDLEITVTVPASIEPGFATTAPAHHVHGLLAKSRKSNEVSFAIDHGESSVGLDTGKTKFEINTLPVDDFPVLEFSEPDNSFVIDGNQFWNMLNNVKRAISNEETRYYLRGVYFHEHDNQLVAVATDGHRLYHQVMDMPQGGHGMASHIIPRKTINTFLALTKATKNRPDTVRISINETKIEIAFDNVQIRSKVIDGTFPDYNRVIPQNPTQFVEFEADGMADAIKDVSLVSSDRGRAIKLTIIGDNMDLTVNNPDSGSARANITGNHGTADIEIGFNAGYLTEILGIISDGPAKFGLTDSGAPTVITGNIEGWKAVLMPMRV